MTWRKFRALWIWLGGIPFVTEYATIFAVVRSQKKRCRRLTLILTWWGRMKADDGEVQHCHSLSLCLFLRTKNLKWKSWDLSSWRSTFDLAESGTDVVVECCRCMCSSYRTLPLVCAVPEMEDFINNRKGHVIAKKYSRQIRSTIFRRRAEAEQAEQTEALQDSPQRKPLAAFPEGQGKALIHPDTVKL